MTNLLAPVLGSELLLRARELRLHQESEGKTLKTSNLSIDAAIGGIRPGEITCIQSDAGGYGSLIAHHIIASHLLLRSDHEDSQVAYIDTVGTFSAVNLLKVLMIRLQHEATQVLEERGGIGIESKDIRGKAAQLLDSVQYIRAFDFDGVVDAVAEVSMGIQKSVEDEVDNQDEDIETQDAIQGSEASNKEDTGVQEAKDLVMESVHEAIEGHAEEQLPSPDGHMEREEGGYTKSIVPDSQADSDEEILWPEPPLPKHDHGKRKKRKQEHTDPNISAPQAAEQTEKARPIQEQETTVEIESDPLRNVEHMNIKSDSITPSEEPKHVGLLIVDSISRPTEELLEAKELIAHRRLTEFTRNLKKLARDKNMTVLLLSTPLNRPVKVKQPEKDIYVKHKSVFARILPTTGLNTILDRCVDVKIMISRYLKEEHHRRRSGGQEPLILEILSDKAGCGGGKWATFMVKDGTEIVDVFEEKKKDLDYLLTDNERRGKGAFGRWSRD